MRKKVLSLLIVFVMLFGIINVQVDAEMLGLTTVASKERGPFAGAVDYAPEEYTFTFEEQKFAFLGGYIGADGVNQGYLEDGGKYYYLVLADANNASDNGGIYEKMPWGVNGDDTVWSVEDETKIGYWLNDEEHGFISEEYEGTKLPSAMVENLYSYEWHCEPTKVEGYKSEFVVESKVALMSRYEFLAYAGMFDGRMGGGWWLRTASSTTGRVMYVSGNPMESGGMLDAIPLDGSWGNMNIRPIFWLSEDFFLENKLTNPGDYVLSCLDKTLTRQQFIDAGAYSEDDLNALFTAPTAVVNGIMGNPVAGNEITVNYTYSSSKGYLENGTTFQWYRGDLEDGTDKEEIDGAVNESYTLTQDDGGKYIFVSVKPASNLSIGSEAFSTAFGTIYSDAEIAPIVEAIDALEGTAILDGLSENNYIFDLDLDISGLSPEEQENLLTIFADADITDYQGVCDTWNKAVILAQLNYCTDAVEGEELIRNLLSEEDLAIFDAIGEKSHIIDGMCSQGFTSQEDAKVRFDELAFLSEVNEKTPAEKLSWLDENRGSYSEEFSKYLDNTEARVLFAAAGALDYCSSLEAFEPAMIEAIEEIKLLLKNEKPLGLVKINGMPSIDNVSALTPAKNSFTYEGKSFAFLDQKEKNGKKYYLIYADNSYGSKKIHDQASASANAAWDATDSTRLAYWLNNEFLSSEYTGAKLPESMIAHLDYTNIWHTEPCVVDGYSSEDSMITVGPVSIMSYYEAVKYAGSYGVYTDGSNQLVWLRSSRSEAAANKNRVYSFGGTLEGSTLAIAFGEAHTERLVRPIFWLCEDFFKENKISNPGGFLAYTLDATITRDELLDAGYTNEEINNWFKAPTAVINSIEGEPIVGQTLTVDYTYSHNSGFEENGTVITWKSSTDGVTYSEIIGQGESYTLTENEGNKYVKPFIEPKCLANINSTGSIVAPEVPLGPIYNQELLQEAVDAVEAADAGSIVSTLEAHNSIFNLDLSFDGLSVEEKADAIAIFAQSELTDLETLRAEFYLSQTVAMVNTRTAPSELEALLGDEERELGIDTNQFNEKLTDKTFVLSKIDDETFATTETFAKAFNEAVAVTRISESDRTTAAEAIADNIGAFTADLSEMDEYRLGLIGAEVLGTYEDFATLDAAVTVAAGVVNGLVGDPEEPNDGPSPSPAPPAQTPSISGPSSGGSDPKPESKPEVKDTSIYKDMSDTHWAYPAIKALSDKNILSGDADGGFRPDDTLKREEFVKMIVLALGKTAENTQSQFTDIDQSAWYATYINIALENKIINGISEEKFGIGEQISRQDMAVIIYRALGDGITASQEATFADMNKVSDYALDAVNALSAAGLLNGDGENVNPLQFATRAQAAKMVYSLIEYIGGVAK